MSDWFVRLHLGLARHRGAAFMLVALFVTGALFSARSLKLNEDYTDMLPMSEPAIAEQLEALRHVRQADRLFVDIQTAELDPERLALSADRMHAALQEIPELTELRYRFEAGEMLESFQEIQAQLPALLQSNQLHELQARLELPVLEQRLAWMKKAMTQPQGLMLKNVVHTDPVGLGDAVSEQLRRLQARVGDARIVAGRITSADGLHVLISAVPAFRASEIQRSALLLNKVLNAARTVEAGFPDGSVRVAVTGAHRVALENATLIRKDTTLTTAIATVAVAALMFSVFRQRWLALAGLTPTLFGALGAILVFYLTGDAVSAIALGCGSILIGVTVDYGIYVLYLTDDVPPCNREQLARAVAQLVPALAFGALTTMAAFLVMFISPVSGHRQLGAFGAVGVALAAWFALVILPLFVPVGRPVAARGLPLTSAMERLFRWRDRQAFIILPLLLVFSGLCLAGLLRLRFEGDFARLNGVTAETRRDEELIREVWGKALSLTTVVVTGTSREEALRQNEQVCAVLQLLRDQGAVESFASIAPIFPSEQTRKANQGEWSVFWSESRRQNLSNSLAVAGAKLGFRTGTFAPFLERITAPRLPGNGDGATRELERLLADFFSEKEGLIAVCTLVKASGGPGFGRLREAIRAEVPGALLLNKAALSDEITRVARKALPVFAALIIALNAVLLFLVLGRVELVLITLLPMAAGVFWTLGTLGLLGQPINMANFIFTIFVIGVGGDYSLFMLMAELHTLRGRTDRTASTGGAVTLCAGTTLLGMGALVLAQHPAMFSLGLSAWLGISFTLLATLFLIPTCMAALRRRIAATSPSGLNPVGLDDLPARRKQVTQLYRYQGVFVEQFVYWKLRTDPLFRALDEAVPGKGLILDAGCGFGLVAHWLAFSAPKRTFHGLDHDAEKISVARSSARNHPRLAFEQGDLLKATWPPCDVVLLCDVLHYFPRELKLQILHRAFDALHPGGRVILRDDCSDAPRGHRLVAWAERIATWTGQNKASQGLHFEPASAWIALLAKAGFIQPQKISEAGLGSNIMLAARKPGRCDSD